MNYFFQHVFLDLSPKQILESLKGGKSETDDRLCITLWPVPTQDHSKGGVAVLVKSEKGLELIDEFPLTENGVIEAIVKGVVEQKINGLIYAFNVFRDDEVVKTYKDLTLALINAEDMSATYGERFGIDPVVNPEVEDRILVMPKVSCSESMALN